MIYRVFIEKKNGLTVEADELLRELVEHAGLRSLKGLRIVNRYDVEGLSREEFDDAVRTVLSDPRLDSVSPDLCLAEGERAFALEYLPGQYDQRADAAAQCIQMRAGGERPLLRTARVYVLAGGLSRYDEEAAVRYLLNPVESRLASMNLPDTLRSENPVPRPPAALEGFRNLDEEGLDALIRREGLALGVDDLLVCRDYFRSEGRDPSMTELKVLDTYWSDHCRHTTFLTEITGVVCETPAVAATLADFHRTKKRMGREDKPFTLMEVVTLATRWLKERGELPEYEETEENNACTLKVTARTEKGPEDWLLFFKNETHNHPTEIEPFGGASTCLGGAIRDPLSARAYVYAGMRVTGASDPTAPVESTLLGKLPQRRITRKAAEGFASYGNQIGVPTGCAREIYHPGYVAKRMEAGAVLAAAKASHVRRERPSPGDVVLLVGGRTGRDGCGGAAGSSVEHTRESADVAAAQVQKGDAPEERKIQRFFRSSEVSLLIKRCNDFGAGGVSVAIGELAAGLDIDLDAVKVKYEGLDATELAISESQERMAVVVEAGDVSRFVELAARENLEVTPVATVSESPRLVMRWRGHVVVDLARSFLDENGARKSIAIEIAPAEYQPSSVAAGLSEGLLDLAEDLNACSQRGMIERFDSTAGAATLLAPLGGRRQATPPAAMVHILPVPGGSETCSFMSFGYNPFISSRSPYHGAYLAVVESVAGLVAAGAPVEGVYLSLQEFFPKPGTDPRRWGLPLAAALGAYRAQMELGIAAIGGKDSMSGTFEELDVPPTLISFAVAAGERRFVQSPEFKRAGSRVVWLRPDFGEDGLPSAESLRRVWEQASRLIREGMVLACAAPSYGGAALALMNMAQGNGIGVKIDEAFDCQELFSEAYGSLILEVPDDCTEGRTLGLTAEAPLISLDTDSVSVEEFERVSERRLSGVFPSKVPVVGAAPLAVTVRTKPRKGPSVARPRVLLPVFPGTHCEDETATAFERAGAKPQILVIRNRTASEVAESAETFAQLLAQAQILMIPGGMSTGGEPDGMGKFIAAFLRRDPVRESAARLLDERDGLVGGVGDGFHALLGCGLLPFGRFTEGGEDGPALARNLIGRHQSRLVTVRVSSSLSPWFAKYRPGESYTVPISTGEGRFLCSQSRFDSLAEAGQIAAQYCDETGEPSMMIDHNPPGADFAVEALTSPDGRVMGRMGHAERMLPGLYLNVPNSGQDPMFEAATEYYS